MPIYAYRCQDCGFAKDVLQKVSDPPLTECPECKKATFAKQLTAAGFHLKGTGWYVTDFRDGQKKPASSGSASNSASNSASGSSAADSGSAKTDTASAATSTSTDAA